MVALADWVTNCSPISNWRNFPAWRGGKGWSVGRLGGTWWWCFSYWFVEFSPGGHRRRDFKLSRNSTTNGMSLRSSLKLEIAELYSSIYPRLIDWWYLVYLDWMILLIGFSLVEIEGFSESWLVHISSGDMWIIWKFSPVWLGFCIKITCCGLAYWPRLTISSRGACPASCVLSLELQSTSTSSFPVLWETRWQEVSGGIYYHMLCYC